jgi:hypothetical protein
MNTVPARCGWKWVVTGFALFRKNPAMWAFLVFSYIMLMQLLGMVPLFGWFAASVLIPVFSASFMIISRNLDQGQRLRFGLLFSGFRSNLRALLTQGGLYLASALVILALSALVDGGALLKLMVLGDKPLAAAFEDGSLAASAAFAGALYLPLLAAFWFAPALSAWRNLPAVKALFYSFFACMRNWRAFLAYGLALLCDVPTEAGTVAEVGAELGCLRTTSWGTVFDVVSMVDANSLAYTNLPLVVHTDEGYRDPAPTIQLQHFLRCDTSGGQATLTDGFKVATDLREEHPELFQLLVDHSLQFHFADATAEHVASGPVLTLTAEGALQAVRYSNHSVLPFRLPADVMEPYYRAYRTFGAMRESPQYQLRLDMQAGELYMVDNRRVMHGRSGFTGGGSRHLQSCYIERDELASRLAVLERGLRHDS